MGNDAAAPPLIAGAGMRIARGELGIGTLGRRAPRSCAGQVRDFRATSSLDVHC